MGLINVLDQNTINQIAAGEVIDRPSSVVKELVENAIDAGADKITVEIENGGLDMIRISDNGQGFYKDDIKTAFLRHATSKIKSADDLLSISSLGFRGEALSSVAAIAKVELLTKRAENSSGYRYVIEGGEEKVFEETGIGDGTVFCIRDIFYNTPARRKFLKSAATEGGYIYDIIEKMSLSNVNVAFRLILNGKEKLSTVGNGKLKDAIYSVYGKDVSSNLIEFNCENDFINIYGYIGKPILTRGNRNSENYYINKRYIKNNIISKGIEEGYKTFMMQHMYPFTMLYITIDNDLIDVNVHPAKMEIRLKRQEEIFDLLAEKVAQALKDSDLIREASIGKEDNKANINDVSSKEITNQRTNTFAAYNTTTNIPANTLNPQTPNIDAINNPNISTLGTDINISEKYESNTVNTEKEQVISDYGIKRSENYNNLVNDIKNANEIKDINNIKTVNDTTSYITPPVSAAGDISLVNSLNITETESVINLSPKEDLEHGNVESVLLSPKENDSFVKTESVDLKEEFRSKVVEGKQESFIAPNVRINDERPYFTIIGQVFDTYWIIEYKNSMYIIDQHAAHEKVNYENYLKAYKESGVNKQYLSPPQVVSLSGASAAIYEEHKEILDRFGYELEPFGPKEYLIRAVPYDLLSLDYSEVLSELLGELENSTSSKNPDIIKDRIATMSCKAAIKGNQKISRQEADNLISQMLMLDNPFNCPHGRPTTIEISKYEMEKKFKRIL